MNFNYQIARGKRLNPPEIENLSSTVVQDSLTLGLQKPFKDSLDIGHPLEHIEKNRPQTEFHRNMNMLRNIQGIHAPLRIAMELKSFDNVGRLPFLSSSNLSRDVLLGRDDSIDFTDILNPPEVHENSARPHIFMERKLGIL